MSIAKNRFVPMPSWLHQTYASLELLIKIQRVPHAILISGNKGIGKSMVAHSFAKTLLCNTEFEIHCKSCKSCHLFDSAAHADFLEISPVNSKTVIGIDQIRNAIAFGQKTSVVSNCKVLIINPAESMNRNASNGLLKLLEEPPPKTILILVSSRDYILPATVISRCSRFHFQNPSNKLAYEWLNNLLPEIDEISKKIALLLRNPIEAAELIQTQEFKNLIAEIDQYPIDYAYELGVIQNSFSNKNPDILTLEYVTILIELLIKNSNVKKIKDKSFRQFFYYHEKLRKLVSKVEGGMPINIELNFYPLLVNLRNINK